MLRTELAALSRLHGREGRSSALMREADAQMAGRTIDDIFEEGLHQFLLAFMARNNAIAQAISTDYRFLS